MITKLFADTEIKKKDREGRGNATKHLIDLLNHYLIGGCTIKEYH